MALSMTVKMASDMETLTTMGVMPLISRTGSLHKKLVSFFAAGVETRSVKEANPKKRQERELTEGL